MESQADSSVIKSAAPSAAKEGSIIPEEAKGKTDKTESEEQKIGPRPDNQGPKPKEEKEENKDADEPFPRTWMQRNILSLVRPFITLALTLAFIILVVSPLFALMVKLNAQDLPPADMWNNVFAPYMDKMLPIFLAVYGPIIGFWFGEKTALKVPGKSG